MAHVMTYEEKAAWSRRWINKQFGPFADKVFRLVEWAAIIGLMGFLAKSRESIVLGIVTCVLFALLWFYLYDVVRGYVPLIVKPEANDSKTRLRTIVHVSTLTVALLVLSYTAFVVTEALLHFQSGQIGAPQP
jgi:hypothetical protein